MRPIVLLCACACLLLTTNAWAAPEAPTVADLLAPSAATVSPNRCLLTSSVPVAANGEATFLLHHNAAPNDASLLINDPDAAISSITSTLVPLLDDAALAELRQQLDAARFELESITAQLAAVDAQLEYLQHLPGFKPESAQEALSAAEGMGARMAELGAQRLPLVNKRDAAAREVERLETELQQMTGNAYHAWRVTATFSGVTKATTATVAYPLAGCGWRPFYRLDARPADEAVAFTYEAEVWQQTGKDWNNIQLTLATSLPDRGLTPPPMQDWVIQPIKPAPAKGARTAYKMAPLSPAPSADSVASEVLAAEAAPPAPVQANRATYTAWDMGQRTLPAGEKPRFEISVDAWPAAFRYTVRPAYGPEAWLTANATLPAVQDLPYGDALFLVDGALAGRRPFSMAGNQTDLFFGEAPFIKTTAKLLAKESGEKGLLSTKQTYRWQWSYAVENLGQAPALVRVEEPNPQRRDEQIDIKTESTPKAQTTALPGDKQIFFWEEELQPGKSMAIIHGVSITAPGDMNLDTGWR